MASSVPHRAAPPEPDPPAEKSDTRASDEVIGEFGVWRRPIGSLPTRAGFFVLSVTLCTALVITGVSLESIDSFLREKTQQGFPVLLDRTASDLSAWYEARRKEADQFRRDPVLASYWRDLSLEPGFAQRARDAIARQLERRLAMSDAFESAFILDADGNTVHWQGPRALLSPEMLSQTQKLDLTPAERWEGHGLQLARVRFDPPPAPTLHLLLELENLTEILRAHGRLLEGRISIVDRGNRRYVASSAGGELPGRFAFALPGPGETLEAHEVTGRQGERVLLSAVSLPNHDWTLVIEEDYERAYAQVVAATRRVLGINLAIVALFALAAYRFAVKLVQPIEALSRAAQRISAGEKNVPIPRGGTGDELRLLTRAFSEMTDRVEANARELEQAHESVERANAELVTRNEDLHRANEVLARLSVTDGLTGLHNHRHFQDSLTREAKRVDRTGESLALILVDIDHFKAWNDRLGHAAGDEILRRVAQVMQELLRTTDLLARYGGEEFALLAPGTDLEGATRLAEKMRTTISQTRFFIAPPSEQESVTVSMGVARYRGDRKRLFSDADRALYRAKASGRDCVIVFDDDIDA